MDIIRPYLKLILIVVGVVILIALLPVIRELMLGYAEGFGEAMRPDSK